MPNSLKSRLKGLVRKGLLSEKDLNRIIIIPDNATNGEAIKALFDNEMAYNLEFYIKNYMLCTDWWNAPYKLSELKGENK